MRQIVFLIIILLLSSCSGSGGGAKINTDSSIHQPVHITSNRSYAAALDDRGNIWQWEFNNNWQASKPKRVRIKNVVGFCLNHDHKFGWAVTAQGELHMWSFWDPDLTEHLETDKPVRKATTSGDFTLLLHTDGTLSSNKKESLMGVNAPSAKNDRLKLEELQNIVDYYWGVTYLVAINKDGDCYAASGTGLNSLLPNQPPTADGKPVKIDGLSNIKRFYEQRFHYFAFDKDNRVYYYRNGAPIQTLDKSGNNVTYNRLLTADGTNYFLNHSGSSVRQNKTEGIDKLSEPKRGYGTWYLSYNSRKVVALDEKGVLWEYDYDPSAEKGQQTSNPKRIGNFTVNLDYFTL